MDPVKPPFLSNLVYDRLKWVALVGLPALGTLYYALAKIWNLPSAEEVLGTVLALDTALGTLLGLSKKQYDNSDAKYDGALNIVENEHRLIHRLDIYTPPEEIGGKDSITLKVAQVSAEE